MTANPIDVAICFYGKPFQTAATLASLFHHSGHLIDTIYLQQELSQPHGASVEQVLRCFPDRHFVHFTPEWYLSWHAADRTRLHDPAYRRSIRYQQAWEDSDKEWLFVTHNDVLYNGDILGNMLERAQARRAEIWPEAGVVSGLGWIGQCWNCPAHKAGHCSSEIFPAYQPSYQEARQLVADYPQPRTTAAALDPGSPMPLPECRLNEFACLLNLARTRDAVVPRGDVLPFGFMGLDIGTDWFHSLVVRGHEFLNWRQDFTHAPFSRAANGHTADFDAGEYLSSEAEALAFLRQHHPRVADRLAGSAQ